MVEKNKNSGRRVWASELAEMKVCEQRVVFDHKVGKRLTPSQASSIARGIEKHTAMDASAKEIMRNQRLEGKPWCFVATLVFGKESNETRSLREFRDEMLRKSVSGRLLTKMYYKWSPALARVISRTPGGVGVTRMVLRVAIAGGTVVKQASKWATR